jgi:acyl-CoA thioesterase
MTNNLTISNLYLPDINMDPTPFSTIIDSIYQEHNHYNVTLPADWLQGRTAYGGLSAALCLEATNRSLPDLPPLRSAQFSFIGPATRQLNISPNVLRRGKSTVFVGTDLNGESGLAVRSSLCFGSQRGSTHDHDFLPMPKASRPDECDSYYVWQNRPNFMNHFEGRLVKGALPFTSGTDPEMIVWLRHNDTGDDSSLVRLLALADALPPAALVMSSDFIPISTMTWSIEILDTKPFTSKGWWLVHAVAETSREGYSTQNTFIWNSEGKPILTARQNVAIFG